MSQILAQTIADSVNKVVIANGKRGPTQHAIFTDDNLLACVWMHLKTGLDCSVESLFMLLGNPESNLHRSPLTTDKNVKNMFSCLCTQLGTRINTRDLALRIPDTKRADLETILLTNWNSSRKRFTLREVASLLELVCNLALTTQWVKSTCIVMQHAVSIALNFN